MTMDFGLTRSGIYWPYEPREGRFTASSTECVIIIRRGQKRLYQEVLLVHRPAGHHNMKFFDLNHEGPLRAKIHEALGEVLKLRVCFSGMCDGLRLMSTQKCGQATNGMEYLLKALWHSEFLFRLHEYRTGIILLADVGLEFGMSRRSRALVDDIMPQVNPFRISQIVLNDTRNRSSVGKIPSSGVLPPSLWHEPSLPRVNQIVG